MFDIDRTTFIWLWMIGSALPFLLLFFIRAPYGRHARSGWGPSISARLGWIIMESPSLLIMLMFFVAGRRWDDPMAWVFLIMWETHYVHRSWIYPFRARIGGKTMPSSVAMMAVFFNSVNAGINGDYLFNYGPGYELSWLADPRFILGFGIFATGMFINMQSDTILLRLRRTTESGYKIPRGGMYRWVSCPNYLGEMMEWVGWAIATWSLAGAAFAVWTIANLLPRAMANHSWYQETFDDYPNERKALVPFVF